MNACQNPLMVQTSRGLISVGCGKCAYCLNFKGTKRACYLDLEHLSCGSAYFMTLTYANYFLPIGNIDSYLNNIFVIPHTLRSREVMRGENFVSVKDSKCNVTYKDLDIISNKTGLPRGFIPVLMYRDVSLFFKRFKQYLHRHFKIPYEYVKQIRYYYCGEYGIKHFRPHYHVLLFLPKDIQFKIPARIMRLSLRTCWTFGRVDFQRSKGKNSSYLAEYLNSYTFMPSIYYQGSIRPRAFHSNFFSEGYFPSTPQEVLLYGSQYFEPVPYTIGGIVKFVVPPLSIQAKLFPRCYRFELLSFRQLKTSYLSYEYAIRELGCSRVSPFKIAEYVDSHHELCIYKSLSTFCGEVIHLSTLQSIFYCSFKFLKNLSIYNYSCDDYLNLIIKFYDNKQQWLLRHQYLSQEDYIQKYVVDSPDHYSNIYYLVNWYDNFVRYNCQMRDGSFERSSFPRLLGAPSSISSFLTTLSFMFLDNFCLPEKVSDLHFTSNPAFLDVSRSSLETSLRRIKHREYLESINKFQ